MKTETELSAGGLQISMPSRQQKHRTDWIMEQITVLAEAFGEALTPERLRVYAHDFGDLDLESLRLAFTCARRELKFFPKIAEIRKLAGAGREQAQDAEARKAWDILASFVRKYVSNDVHGNYGPEHGWYPKSHPKLSDRILATVRRTGGWKLYACMTDGDFPFVQKRFFEDYEAWIAVESIEVPKQIQDMPRFQLVAKPMNVLEPKK